MRLDDAIKVALEYESGIHKMYLDAMNEASDENARRMFEILCREEAEHLDYLQSRLIEWQKDGKIKAAKLSTAIPAREVIEKSLREQAKMVKPKDTKQIPELELLKKALDAEIKASNFFREMVQKLDSEGQELFKRFVEIEEGHEAIVEAQINAVGNWGFWFDIPEFRLEME
jgi:rubrerythrin